MIPPVPPADASFRYSFRCDYSVAIKALQELPEAAVWVTYHRDHCLKTAVGALAPLLFGTYLTWHNLPDVFLPARRTIGRGLAAGVGILLLLFAAALVVLLFIAVWRSTRRRFAQELASTSCKDDADVSLELTLDATGLRVVRADIAEERLWSECIRATPTSVGLLLGFRNPTNAAARLLIIPTNELAANKVKAADAMFWWTMPRSAESLGLPEVRHETEVLVTPAHIAAVARELGLLPQSRSSRYLLLLLLTLSMVVISCFVGWCILVVHQSLHTSWAILREPLNIAIISLPQLVVPSLLLASNLKDRVLRAKWKQPAQVAQASGSLAVCLTDEAMSIHWGDNWSHTPWSSITGFRRLSSATLFETFLGQPHLLLPTDPQLPEYERMSRFAEQQIAAHGGPDANRIRFYLSIQHVPCPKCKYDLFQNITCRCPECGLELTRSSFPVAMS